MGVITYCLAQRPTLPHRNLITVLNTESGRHMRSQVLVSFLVSRILGNEMEVFTPDDERSVHFRRHNGAGQDTPADGDLTSEWTFLVYIAENKLSGLYEKKEKYGDLLILFQ